MQPKIYKFWEENSLANIKPNIGEEFPEGWNVVDYFKNFQSEEEYGDIVEIGCGYGRLCKAFNPKLYLGLDISPAAIKLARTKYSEYKFKLIKEDQIAESYPRSKTKLLYTVMLHQPDEDLIPIVQNLCATSEQIIIAEICGYDWRRSGNPPVFNRNPEDYDYLFRLHGKGLSHLIKKPYLRYKNYNKEDTNLSIMVFDD